jgi:hypothetical protein
MREKTKTPIERLLSTTCRILNYLFLNCLPKQSQRFQGCPRQLLNNSNEPNSPLRVNMLPILAFFSLQFFQYCNDASKT